MPSHITSTKSFMEIKCSSILAPRKRFCYWKKSYACEGTGKGKERKKKNVKRSLKNRKFKLIQT